MQHLEMQEILMNAYYGNYPVYQTESPQLSYFKVIYRRHTMNTLKGQCMRVIARDPTIDINDLLTTDLIYDLKKQYPASYQECMNNRCTRSINQKSDKKECTICQNN
jgi:hypothetical protein